MTRHNLAALRSRSRFTQLTTLQYRTARYAGYESEELATWTHQRYDAEHANLTSDKTIKNKYQRPALARQLIFLETHCDAPLEPHDKFYHICREYIANIIIADGTDDRFIKAHQAYEADNASRNERRDDNTTNEQEAAEAIADDAFFATLRKKEG